MPKRISSSLMVGSLVVTMAAPAGAADAFPPAFARGAKMRLTMLDHSRVEGYLLEADGQELRIRARDGAQRALPLPEIITVEVARRNSRRRGAAVGALFGGALLGAAGLLAWGGDKVVHRSHDGRTCYGTSIYGGTYEYRCTTAGTLLASVASGTAIGAIVGALKPGERYVPVDSARAAVSVLPVRRGVAVRATMTF